MLGKAAASSLLLLLLWQGTAAVAFVAWCPLPSGRSTASTPSALVAATTTFTGRDDRGGWCLLSSLHPRPPSRPSMSINDITPTNGLTTGPGGVQRGGGGGGGLEPESHLFIHAPTLVRSARALGTAPSRCLSSWRGILVDKRPITIALGGNVLKILVFLFRRDYWHGRGLAGFSCVARQ